MQKKRSITKIAVNAAIFIMLEVAALDMLAHNGIMQDFAVSRAVHGFMAKCWGGAQKAGYYFSLKKTNEALAEENFRLAGQVRRYKEREEAMLTDSIAASYSAQRDSGIYVFSPATLVKVSHNKQHNYLIVDKGSEDGIGQNTGIITSQGVVGIIDAVGKHYSYAMSFMNTGMSVSARLGREGAVGPLVWDGTSSTGAVLKEIPLQYKFNEGDTVFTSGYSSIFPADIPLGLTGSSKIINGATYDIKVTLLQDFNSIKFVTLVTNAGDAEIMELEKKEEDVSTENEKK